MSRPAQKLRGHERNIRSRAVSKYSHRNDRNNGPGVTFVTSVTSATLASRSREAAERVNTRYDRGVMKQHVDVAYTSREKLRGHERNARKSGGICNS